MIVSLLANVRNAALGGDDQRFDAKILFKVGQCRFPLLPANPTAMHVLIDVGNALTGEGGRDEVLRPFLKNVREVTGPGSVSHEARRPPSTLRLSSARRIPFQRLHALTK